MMAFLLSLALTSMLLFNDIPMPSYSLKDIFQHSITTGMLSYNILSSSLCSIYHLGFTPFLSYRLLFLSAFFNLCFRLFQRCSKESLLLLSTVGLSNPIDFFWSLMEINNLISFLLLMNLAHFGNLSVLYFIFQLKHILLSSFGCSK